MFSAAIRESGTLCVAIFRLIEEDLDDDGELDVQQRVVLSCPENDTLLQPLDHVIALVQARKNILNI